MKNTYDNPLENIFKVLYNLIYKLATEYPLTFIFLIGIIIGYYIFRINKLEKYVQSKPKEKLPYFIKQYYYETDSKWNIFRSFIRVFEFCLVLFFSLYILKTIGFKIPEEIFADRNNSNSKIESDIIINVLNICT